MREPAAERAGRKDRREFALHENIRLYRTHAARTFILSTTFPRPPPTRSLHTVHAPHIHKHQCPPPQQQVSAQITLAKSRLIDIPLPTHPSSLPFPVAGNPFISPHSRSYAFGTDGA